MKITLNGSKVRGYKGVDRNGNPYEFAVVSGRTEDGKTARAVFNNAKLYGAITSAPLTILDSVEVEALTKKEHTFTGRAGEPVTVVEVNDPTPTRLVKSEFPTTEKWPEWGDLMKAASASESTDATAAGSDSEAEF